MKNLVVLIIVIVIIFSIATVTGIVYNYIPNPLAPFGATDIEFGQKIMQGPTPLPAPLWVQQRGNQYIISYVGGNYFNEHISLLKSEDLKSVNNFGAQYVLHYKYRIPIKETPNSFFPTIKDLVFTLWLDPKGELVEYSNIKYRGPQKPYKFLISRSEALQIAKENGLPESTTVTGTKGENVYTIQKPTTADIKFGLDLRVNNEPVNESYVWVVATENIQDNKPEAIILDVDTGDVLGISIYEEGIVVSD